MLGPLSSTKNVFTKIRQTRTLDTLAAFTSRKTASFRGPFSQLPEFTPLPDSILVSLPPSCSIYSKLSKINLLTFYSKSGNKPLIHTETNLSSGFSKVSAGEEPVNAMLISSTPISNVLVIELDDYKQGWCLKDPQNSIMCYSGDLEFQRDSQRVLGRGVLAISGQGPLYRLHLEENETIDLCPESIVAHSEGIRSEISRLGPHALKLNSIFEKYAGGFLEALSLKWNRWFNMDRVFCRVSGPGIVLLQTSFVPATKTFSDDELLKAFK